MLKILEGSEFQVVGQLNSEDRRICVNILDGLIGLMLHMLIFELHIGS